MIPIERYTYLILLITSVFFPLLFSFDKRVHFYTQWKALFWATLLPAFFFVIWDIWFTKLGVWGFNDAYIVGFRLFGLPLEEWLFFIVIPYCSVFVYEVLHSYFPKANFNTSVFWGFILLDLVFILLAAFGFQERYTFWNFGFNAVVLFFLLLQRWFSIRLTHFLLTFLICLLPMLLVNGILTALPIVSYNSLDISGIMISTIPFEDFFYYFLLLMMNLWVYEGVLRSKKSCG